MFSINPTSDRSDGSTDEDDSSSNGDGDSDSESGNDEYDDSEDDRHSSDEGEYYGQGSGREMTNGQHRWYLENGYGEWPSDEDESE